MNYATRNLISHTEDRFVVTEQGRAELVLSNIVDQVQPALRDVTCRAWKKVWRLSLDDAICDELLELYNPQ